MVIGDWTCFFFIMEKNSSFLDPILMIPIQQNGRKENHKIQVNSATLERVFLV